MGKRESLLHNCLENLRRRRGESREAANAANSVKERIPFTQLGGVEIVEVLRNLSRCRSKGRSGEPGEHGEHENSVKERIPFTKLGGEG